MIHSTTDERGVVTLTIDRPERRNALDRSTMRGIAETLAVAENGTHIRALVVRGNGGTFSAGRDLKEAAELKLDAALADFVDRIVALDQAAVRQTLETFRAAQTMPLDQSLTMGLHLNQLLDAGGSFSRGGAAFAERQAKKDR